MVHKFSLFIAHSLSYFPLVTFVLVGFSIYKMNFIAMVREGFKEHPLGMVH